MSTNESLPNPIVQAACEGVTSNVAGRIGGDSPEAKQVDALEAEIKAAPAPTAPATRDVIIKVPADVTESEVNMAIRLGIMASGAIHSGMMFLAWPAIRRDEKGNAQRVIQQTYLPLSGEGDVNRVLQLVKVIGETNMAAEQPGADPLASKILGDKAKDNASRELAGQASGNAGGIILP